VPRDKMLVHIAEIVSAADVPVNADFEGGYADEPEGVAESVRLCVATGVAGLSIEDSTGSKEKPLYDFDLAVERIKAARKAIDDTAPDVLLTARTEGFIRGRPDLAETIRRLKAFADAGADCLYAPGIKGREEITAVVQAVAPKPVNLLMGWAGALTVGEIATLGVRRISVGGALARAAWGGFIRSARQIAIGGTFAGFSDAAPAADLNALFQDDIKRRPAS
jgi:2-methylisocitrate lyase-like PEP mutase family enzyme